MFRPSCWESLVVVAATLATACAGDNRVDPSNLPLRDVLGIAPEAAAAWDAGQRAAARRVLGGGLRAPEEPAQLDDDPGGGSGNAIDDRVASALTAGDAV